MISKTKAHAIRFAVVGVCWTSLTINVLLHVWAAAILAAGMSALVTFEAIRQLLHDAQGREDGQPQRTTLPERLLDEIEHPDPLKTSTGYFLIFAVLLIIAIDDGYYQAAWVLVPLLAIQALAVTVLAIRRRRAQRSDSPKR